ncbi:MAG: hypothetical protein ACOYYS_12315 [Chloroflexota bacterium]
MADTEAYSIFERHAPDGYVNATPARVMFDASRYRPILRVQEIRHPVLFQVADRESLVSNRVVEEAARILGEYAEVKPYPIGHFDIYTGEHFERSVSDQVRFLQACIGATE